MTSLPHHPPDPHDEHQWRDVHDPADDPLVTAASLGLPAFVATADPNCWSLSPDHFGSMEAQQAAFDGEAQDPSRDYAAARELCMSCPLLHLCRAWASTQLDHGGFLGGETAERRRERRRRAERIRLRRGRVRVLRRRGVSTVQIADLLEVDPTTVREDLRALGLR